MNLAPEIKNILAVQNILISISFSWTKLRKNYYHSQQHVPSKYLINDGTPPHFLQSVGGNPGNKMSPPPATLQVFFITPLR